MNTTTQVLDGALVATWANTAVVVRQVEDQAHGGGRTESRARGAT